MSVCAGCAVELPPNKDGRGRHRKWCSDRCRKQTLYGQPCIDCGEMVSGSDGKGAHLRCGSCNGRLRGKLNREAWAPRRAEIERLWAEGKTCREICEALGVAYASNFIAVCRYKGFDVPHRRPQMAKWGKRLHDKRMAARVE